MITLKYQQKSILNQNDFISENFGLTSSTLQSYCIQE